MFNTFPDLLAFSFFAPVFLRLALGIPFILLGYRTLFKNHEILANYFSKRNLPLAKILATKVGLIELITGILITIGLLTQISVLLTICLSVLLINIEEKKIRLNQSNAMFYVFIGISLALLFTGAGVFAFDIPL